MVAGAASRVRAILRATVMVRAWLGLGSNLQDPERQVCQALDELDQLDDCSLVAASSLYKSPPMGPADQPDYINAVACIETGLEPGALLAALQGLEQRHGRERLRHWGERTLDLDILLYGEEVVNQPGLVIPHPGLHERAFVLYPLYEISPDLVIPGLGELKTLRDQVDGSMLERRDR